MLTYRRQFQIFTAAPISPQKRPFVPASGKCPNELLGDPSDTHMRWQNSTAERSMRFLVRTQRGMGFDAIGRRTEVEPRV